MERFYVELFGFQKIDLLWSSTPFNSEFLIIKAFEDPREENLWKVSFVRIVLEMKF